MRARRAVVNGSWMAQSMHASVGDAAELDPTARRRPARARSRPRAPGPAPARPRSSDRIGSRP